MPEDGCIPNEVRGGGCYWGPNVTEDFLNKHNLQLIIRSHECKQDGYEFCHNRKVRVVRYMQKSTDDKLGYSATCFDESKQSKKF